MSTMQGAFTHPRMIEVSTYLAETRAELVRAAESVPDAQWNVSPVDGAWSAAQIVDHLRIVEHGIVRLFQKVVPDACAAGHPADTETASVLDQVFISKVADRSRRITAPPRVVPAAAPDRAAGLAAMSAEREALLAALAPADGLALGTLQWEHPALGPLDLYRWLQFVGAHEVRHAAQMRECALAMTR